MSVHPSLYRLGLSPRGSHPENLIAERTNFFESFNQRIPSLPECSWPMPESERDVPQQYERIKNLLGISVRDLALQFGPLAPTLPPLTSQSRSVIVAPTSTTTSLSHLVIDEAISGEEKETSPPTPPLTNRKKQKGKEKETQTKKNVNEKSQGISNKKGKSKRSARQKKNQSKSIVVSRKHSDGKKEKIENGVFLSAIGPSTTETYSLTPRRPSPRSSNPYNASLEIIYKILNEKDETDQLKRRGDYELVLVNKEFLRWKSRGTSINKTLGVNNISRKKALNLIIDTLIDSQKHRFNSFETALIVPGAEGSVKADDVEIVDIPLTRIIDKIEDSPPLTSLLAKNRRLRRKMVRATRTDLLGDISPLARNVHRFLESGETSLNALIKYLSQEQIKIVSSLRETYLIKREVSNLKPKTLKRIFKRLNLSDALSSFNRNDQREYLEILFSKPDIISGYTGRVMDDYSEVFALAKSSSKTYLEDYGVLHEDLRAFIQNHLRISDKNRTSALQAYEHCQYSLAIQLALNQSLLAITNTKEFLPKMIRQLCIRALVVLYENDQISNKNYLKLKKSVNTASREPIQWTELLKTVKRIVKRLPKEREDSQT